jgi:hypothetical protein
MVFVSFQKIKQEPIGNSYSDIANVRNNSALSPSSQPHCRSPGVLKRSGDKCIATESKKFRTSTASERKHVFKALVDKEDFFPNMHELSHCGKAWYDRCLFSCKECGDTFANKHNAREHMRDAKHGAYTTVSAERDKCAICDTELLWNRRSLERHFRAKHIGMTVQQYQERYVNFNKKDNEGIKSTDEADILWYEQCLMKCKLCHKTFDTSDSAQAHERRQKHGKCIFVRKVQYQCKICLSSILCSKDTICHHLIDKHGLAISEYGYTYENQEKVEATSICSTEQNSKVNKKSSKENVKEKSPLQEKINLTETTKRFSNVKSRFWYDRCTYKCGSCSKTFINVNIATKHTTRRGHKHYTAVSVSKYICKICDKAITWQRTQIRQHLHTHNLGIDEYGREFEGDNINDGVQLKEESQLNEESLLKKESMLNEQTQLTKLQQMNKVGKPKSKDEVSDSNRNRLTLERYGRTYKEDFTVAQTAPEEAGGGTLSSCNSWFDRCVYQCITCHKTFKSTIPARRHILEKRHKNYTPINTPKYSCKMCNAILLWNCSRIKHHLLHSHKKMSVEEYGRKYEGVELTNYYQRPEQEDYIESSEYESKDKFTLRRRDISSDIESSNEDSPICRVDGVQGQVDHQNIKSFHCPLSTSCSPIFNLDEYTLHLTTVHGMMNNEAMKDLMDEMMGLLRL